MSDEPREPSADATGAGGARAAPLTAAAARRALTAWARRRPAWLVVSVGAGVLAGGLAIVQARLLAGVLSGAFLGGLDLAALRTPLAWLLAVVALRAAAAFGVTSAGQRAGEAVARDVRREATARLLQRGPAYLERSASGELAAQLLEGSERLRPFVARFLPQAALVVAVPSLIAAYVLGLDVLSGVVLVVTGPLIVLFLWLLGTLADARAQRQWRALGMLSAQALDALQGLETLRLFGRARAHEHAMARVGDRYRLATLGVLRVAFLSGFALELLAMLGTAMVAVTVGLRLAAGELPLTVALTTLLLAPEFYLPLRQLGAHHHAAMEGVAAARELLAHLEPDGAAVPEDAPPARPVTVPARPTPRGPPTIALRRVHARYPGSRVEALRGFDLELPAGSVTALIGATGAGKSSAARLLLGTLQASRGSVLVDGRDLTGLDADRWRRRLAWVPQRPHLFDGSVLDNLRLGRPLAPFEEVEAAARRAEADAFIRRLPDGYATRLGEDGHDLSGGERQRLAIARALVRDADVVILDEATAHLDSATEEALLRALERLVRGRTVLLIAHRLRTLSLAERIAVVDGGRVEEAGSPGELLALDGRYARLLRTAAGVREEAAA